MIQFFQSFPDEAIVSTLSAQWSWSHFIEFLPLKDQLARVLPRNERPEYGTAYRRAAATIKAEAGKNKGRK